MANLETLELTINGSAEQAKTGIDNLISRLSDLSDAITKPYSDLRDFNAALRETASLTKRINLTNIGKRMGASAAKAAGDGRIPAGKPPTAQEIADSNARMEELRKGAALPAEALAAQQAVSKRLIQERMAATAAKRAAFEARQRATAEAKVAEEVQKTTEATKEQGSGLAKVKEGFKGMTSGISGFFSKVKRIATTMLIRSAIRGLIRDIKEGVNNFYEWSKLNNGEFAKSFDTIKAKGQELKNSIGAAIAPVIAAAIPVVQALANAAINAFNWVNQLIALLSGKNYWTKATDNVDAYTDSVNKAGGAAKEWLASFDELNVMTSGGGGGGGGASGITSDMFENTTQFNTALKEIVGFIKDNFDDIKLIAGEIGAAILAWKISQAFANTLPALSQIAGLIGVGAVIAIQLQASYLLTDKYLKTGQEGWLIASALTTAIGAAAAGTIAKKIFGGKIATATIGFALIANAITDIVANVQNTDVKAFSKEGILTSISAALKAGAGAGVILHFFGHLSGLPMLAAAGGAALFTFLVSTGLKLITSNDNIKWGNFEATQEQIDAYVKQKMFTADVTVIIEQIETILKNKQDIEASIRKQMGQVNTEMNLLSLGIDKASTYANLSELFDGENGIIAQVKNLCDINVDLLKVTFGNMKLYDGSGNAMSTDTLLSGMEGWSKIKGEMEANGKELTELLMKGARGELTPEMEKYTQELLEKVTHMSERITQAEEFGRATADFKTKALAAFSEGSFQGVIDAFDEYSSSYESTIRKTLTETIASWYSLADLTEDPVLKAEYLKIADELTAGFEKTVSEELKSKTAPGIQMIKEWFFGNHAEGSIDSDDIKWELSHTAMTDHLQEILYGYLNTYGNLSDIEINLAKKIKFSGWDLLSKDLKKAFLASVIITDDTIKELKAMDVSADDLVTLVNWDAVTNMAQNDFVKSMTSAYGSEGIKIIKKKFPDIKVTDIVKFSAWDEFSSIEKLNFIDAIGKAFGASEAANAAKQAGIDLEAAIRDGMNSQDEDIKKTAKKWAELMGIEIRGGDYTVKPKVDDGSKKTMKETIEKWIGGMGGKAKVDAEVNDGAKDNVKKAFSTVKAVVNVLGSVTEQEKLDIKKIFESINPKVTVEGKVNWAEGIKTALANKIGSLTVSLFSNVIGKLTFKAGGGLVSSGDMFIANENGVPEMIGRFGNQTGVANTEQIVAGISRGVSEANDEQNYLLREQNALLRAILEKEGSSGIPGASAAFGRTVARSLDMYNGLVGGR